MSTSTSTIKGFAFREGTCDENVYRSVVELNEYRLPEKFEPGDVIIDVGAHIGSFAKACVDRGAGKVVCLEPDIENFIQLRKNLKELETSGRVVLLPAGVWRSDMPAMFLGHTGYSETPVSDGVEVNTGGGDLLHSSLNVGNSAPSLTLPRDSIPSGQVLNVEKYQSQVPVFPLDMLLASFIGRLARPSSLRLLKLDCEYSEWPIIWTSTRLGKVEAICGEFHEPKGRLPAYAQISESHRYDEKSLERKLTIRDDFEFESKRHGDSNLGLFWAWREGYAFTEVGGQKSAVGKEA